MNVIKEKSILITGGVGFVGSHILDILLEENISQVFILDNLARGNLRNIAEALKSEKVTFIEGDISDYQVLENSIKQVDYCIHMAAMRINFCSINPTVGFKTMAEGTYNVVDLCIKHNIKKLVAASSASVYGMADKFPTSELHHPYNNRTFYGAMKMFNELMYRSFNETNNLNYVAHRFFNLYGPRMDTDGKYTEVLIKWYKLIKENKRPLIYGDGKQTMDFINVKDVAKACVMSLKSDISDEVFNIASGEEVSLEELCFCLLKVMNSNLKPEYIDIPDERKNVEVYRRKADICKAKELFGFQSSIGLEEGLIGLVQWLDNLDKKETEAL